MDLVYFRMLIHELLNKDTDIFPEEDPLIILYNNYAVYMDNNGEDIKHKRHITRRITFVRNGEKCKMHNIDLCDGGLKLAYIATNNVGEHNLTPRIKYIMLRLDN